MIKEFTIGKKNCSIVLVQRASKEIIKGTHAFTHDDYEKEVDVHECRGFIGKQLITTEKFKMWTPATIGAIVEMVEKKLWSRIKNEDAEKKTEEQLSDTFRKLGFK